jgi:RNA polymerase sigma-70 factor (ECF subfamily)
MQLYGPELYLAFACAHLDVHALAILEREYVSRAVPSIARIDGAPPFIDEVCQALRERLLLGDAPRIGQYAAAGSLSAWVRVMGVRVALDLKKTAQIRERRECSLEERLIDALVEPAGDGTEQAFRLRVQEALRRAFAALSTRQRNMLRLHYVETLTIDQIAPLYSAHRATVARWLAQAREQILDSVSADLQQRFRLSRSEVHSILVGVRSNLELSILRLLGDARERETGVEGSLNQNAPGCAEDNAHG